MEAKPAKLIEFFSGFKQSVIPLFQRPYEWKEREWSILWKDVLDQYESERATTHFMGAIVTMPTKSTPVGVSKYMVIDGQQRLTTLAVLMCAIRDSLSLDSRPERNRIQNHHLTNDGYENWEYLKLLPTQIDREVFRQMVLMQSIPHESNLAQAYQYFRERIAECDGNDEAIDPKRVLETLEQRLMVVSINLGDADDPYLIFESLNFKGAPLTQADLVRNYYLMRFLTTDQQRIHDQLWLPMQKRLGDDLTEFMRRYVTLKTTHEVRKGEIYADLKKLLIELTPAQAEDSLCEMEAFSRYYLTFIRPDQEPNLLAQRSLARLARWEAETTYPLLLKLADLKYHNHLSQDGYIRALQAIESYIIRRSVCSAPTNQHKRFFVDLAAKVPNEDTTEWLIKNLAESVAGRRWPSDDEFERSWLFNPFTVTSRIGANYCLRQSKSLMDTRSQVH